jgi:hypothetical protein
MNARECKFEEIKCLQIDVVDSENFGLADLASRRLGFAVAKKKVGRIEWRFSDNADNEKLML